MANRKKPKRKQAPQGVIEIMRIFDSHCHLDDHAFDRDRPAVLERARRAGVAGIMIVGTDADASRKAIRVAEAHEPCWASVGVHPHDAKDCSEAVLEALRSLAGSPKVHAWGEIGLDFNRMYSPRADQEKWFIRQLEIALELDLPLIFHERDSNGRFGELIAAHGAPGLRGVVHCFSGTRQELDHYLKCGLSIGITGVLTLQERGEELRQMACEIPADRLLVETDAPYLTPTPERNRHRRNEPAFVKSVLLKLAAVRGEAPEALAETIWANTCRLYEI
jgi:TatD DNase family protein